MFADMNKPQHWGLGFPPVTRNSLDLVRLDEQCCIGTVLDFRASIEHSLDRVTFDAAKSMPQVLGDNLSSSVLNVNFLVWSDRL